MIDWLNRFLLVHGNRYDYSLVDYKNNYTKVKIICKKHGIFEQVPKSHLNDNGCPFCSGGVKLTNEIFIKKSIIKHNNKYDYSLVDYRNSQIKIKIICPSHGIFEQSPASHLQNHGCVECAGVNRSTKDIFVKKSKETHLNRYDYSLVDYKNNKTKVKIICEKHGIFEQVPIKHILRNHGCPKCANEKSSENRKMKYGEFLNRSKGIHDNKYEYPMIENFNNKNIMEIICPIHGKFEQKSYNHLLGGGCGKCANEEIKKSRLSDTNSFIKKSIIKHNNKYDYSLVDYRNSQIKIKIICPSHGIFEQQPYVHLSGCGCPSCNISKGENRIKKFLDDNVILYKKEHKFNDCRHILPLKFDFYLIEKNICIEYDGEQHFKKYRFKKEKDTLDLIQKRDQIKNDYCKKNNIGLLRIKYDQFKNIDHILNEEILKNK